jgi:hypothetical protein
MARRIKSLHHHLGNKNIPLHREHRSKRGRSRHSDWAHTEIYKKKLEELKLEELEKDAKIIISSNKIC